MVAIHKLNPLQSVAFGQRRGKHTGIPVFAAGGLRASHNVWRKYDHCQPLLKVVLKSAVVALG